MLIEFTFENFKCYRNETTLSMEAASLSEHADTLIDGPGSLRCLPVSVIYGPNGGGKSSVLQAFECLCLQVIIPYLVIRNRGSSTRALSCKPYAFDAESRSEPTTFRLLFTEGEYVYRYILSVSNGEVCEEYLHRRKAGKGSHATLFERDRGRVTPGPSLKKKRVNTDVDSMMPYLSFLAINYDIESIEEAFGWMLSCTCVDFSRPDFEEYLITIGSEYEENRTLALLQGMDLDITGIRYERDTEGDLKKILLKHESSSGFELELEEESNGTQKLLSLAPLMLTVLDRGSLLICDELDAKLHPKLLRYIIRLFTDKRTNPKGAQIIFTSHDMTTLNSDVFRRDEIWFAARISDGPASLYSLADITDVDGKRIRTQNSYERQYLAGRYGADPYLRSMLDWENSDE